MLAVLDTTTLTLLLKPTVPPPLDPSTGEPVRRAAERIEYLIEHLSESNARILIPATAWAEFLVAADESAQEYLAKIKDRANFQIVPFDSVSAVEAAIDQRKALKAGNKKADLRGTRQCVKADRQIMAVAKTLGVDMVYAADHDLVKIGASMNVPVTALWDLPLKPSVTPLLDAAEAASHDVDPKPTTE
jgi:predicted nucleic acid-binding protein